jgi:predicted transcriptional regulator
VNLPNGKIDYVDISGKQRAIEALQTLPEQATMDDAIERLCFIAKIEEGIRQSEARQLVSHEDVKKQFVP